MDFHLCLDEPHCCENHRIFFFIIIIFVSMMKDRLCRTSLTTDLSLTIYGACSWLVPSCTTRGKISVSNCPNFWFLPIRCFILYCIDVFYIYCGIEILGVLFFFI